MDCVTKDRFVVEKYLLHADFWVSSSGETYCAVPTKEFALAGKPEKYQLHPTHGTNYSRAKTVRTTPSLTNEHAQNFGSPHILFFFFFI